MINELKRFDVVGYIKPSTREYCDDGECYDADEVDALITEKDDEIAQLNAENENLKYSVATLETDLAMIQRWRKCSEELPEKQEWVFVSDGKHRMLCKRVDGAWLFDGAWMPEEHGKIEYWMPLPKAPKEVDNGLV